MSARLSHSAYPRLIALTALSGAITLWGTAIAQEAPQTAPAGQVNAENFDGKESNEGVYAPESTNAMDQLALAQRMERLKEWTKSADLYQEILTNPHYASKVVPSRIDADHRIYQYTSVEELVMQRLAKWPPDGLEIYRARYEAPASALLQSAKGDELMVLHQVFSRYFVTDSGKVAGLRLMDRYVEDGEFRAAASVGERLLQWHPNIVAERPALLFRTALAYHLAGDDAAAHALAAELKHRYGQDKGIVRGRDVILASSLDEELRQTPPTAVGAAADSYVTFGGDSTRNRILDTSGTPGAHLYSIELSSPRWTNIQPAQAQILESHYKEDAKSGLTLGIMPVIDRGELYFQDGQKIYALSLESGVALSGWMQTHGTAHNGAYVLSAAAGSARTHQLTLTLTEHTVLAVMGQPDEGLYRVGLPAQGETRLVCLDRASGRENWVVSPSQLPKEMLRSLELVGSPLVVGDNVLVAATASKQAGFEDCYVLCFELAKGTYRWDCHVATASTVSAAFAGFAPNFQTPANTIHLAYANGRVYCQTNRGAVAAIDAYNGTIAWLDIYPRGQATVINPAFNPMFFNPSQAPQSQLKPWTFNPVIVSQGMVFTLPLEGKRLLIYDAASGAQVKQINLEDLSARLKSDDNTTESEVFDTLAGVIGPKVVLVGSRAVVALNWKTYDSEHYDDAKMLFWDAVYPQPLRGRPFLSRQRLYLPMEDRLYMLDLASGKAVDEYPKYPRTWGEDEGPGNVLVSSDHTIIAGASHVDVYTDLNLAKAKLDREVAEAPNDPQPRLRYAEVMFAAADYDTSLARLDDAIQKLGGADSMQPGPSRDRVFNDALTFAQKLIADPRPQMRQMVEKLFDRAGEAALSPEQTVHYRVARARFDASGGQPADALKLYQQILHDPATRAVALRDESTRAPASADIVAQKQIDQILKQDPSLYEPYEQEASDALTKAQEQKDPGRMLEVAQEYPNSKLAPKAMLSAAQAYEAAGQVRSSRRILFEIYSNYGSDSESRPLVLESLARADLQLGQNSAAAKLLSQGAVDLHDPVLQQSLKLPDGTQIDEGTSFSAASAKVRTLAYQQQAMELPQFRLPVPPLHAANVPHLKPFLAHAPVIADVDALVAPPREFSRPDRIVTWSAAPRLDIYSPALDKPLASTSGISHEPRGCAWAGQDLLVWDDQRISLLNSDTAKINWTLDVSSLPELEVIAAEAPPEDAEAAARAQAEMQMDQIRLRRQQAIMARRGIVQPIVPVPVAQAAPKPPPGPEKIDQVRPVGQRLMLTTTAGRVVSIEMSDGHIAWQTRLTDRPLERLLANDDFVVVKAQDDASARLVVLDTYSGHVRGTKTFLLASRLVPQNVALSPDGTLVYTMPDRIVLKDLYKRWSEKEIERALPSGQGSFIGLSGPDQLVISEEHVLALSDSGASEQQGQKLVRIYSLQNGEPVMLSFAAGQQVQQALSIGTTKPDVSLRVIGPRLYAIAPDAAVCYNIDHPQEHYTIYDSEMPFGTIYFSFLGSDYMIFVGEELSGNEAPGIAPNPPPPPAAQPPVPEGPAASRPSYDLYAVGRYHLPHGESGRLDYQVKVSDPAGITPQWQPISGGLVYLSADHKLHALLGAGK